MHLGQLLLGDLVVHRHPILVVFRDAFETLGFAQSPVKIEAGHFKLLAWFFYIILAQ